MKLISQERHIDEMPVLVQIRCLKAITIILINAGSVTELYG